MSSLSVAPDAVREELHRVLESHEFRSSKRCQDFLRYAVDSVLAGRADTIKERSIGIDVFGRSSDYDPSNDATVRVKAGEVRKRLSLYYAEKGAQDPIRIDLPFGTYVPEFHVMAAAPPPAESAPEPAHYRLPRRRWLVPLVVLIVGAAVAVAFLRIGANPPQTALNQFWTPVLNGSSPVLVCAAFVPVYGLTREIDPSVPPRHLSELVLLTDQFVGGGDLIAVSRLSAMLTRMERPYRLRIGSNVTFHDLRTGPAILVGYSYTRWQEISRQMRYFIDGTRKPLGIWDSGAPTKWALPDLPADRRTTEDYAIVSRVFHPDTHAMLVEIAGITQYGTDAGSDLVTSPDLLAEALRSAPPDWQRRNLQFVLRVKVFSGVPSSPKVVATHAW